MEFTIMRTLKFRAWDKKNKWWDIGPFWLDDRGQVWEQPNRTYDTPNQEIVSTDELNLMQYTGLKDKNGLDNIYECDIIGVDGLKKGNIYETSTSQIYESGKILKQGIACIVAQMGTKKWRESEQTLLGLGCFYAE